MATPISVVAPLKASTYHKAQKKQPAVPRELCKACTLRYTVPHDACKAPCMLFNRPLMPTLSKTLKSKYFFPFYAQ